MPRTRKANQRIREETRAKILEAARKVFARMGPAAAMSQVAKEAGISQGLAYRYFPSKEAILLTLVKQAAEAGGGFSGRLDEIHGSARERLETVVSHVLEARRREPEFYQLLYHVLGDDKVSKDLREIMKRSGQEVFAGMRQLVVEGQAAGEVANDDPDQLVGVVLACLDGLSRRMLMQGPEEVRSSLPTAQVIMRVLGQDPRGSVEG